MDIAETSDAANIPISKKNQCCAADEDVKEIVELHQGNVTIDSVSGKGSTLIIWLPRAIEPLTSLQ